MLNTPVPLLVAVRVAFEAKFLALTSAPCTTAPAVSVTVPWIEPDWAAAKVAASSRTMLPKLSLRLPIVRSSFLIKLALNQACTSHLAALKQLSIEIVSVLFLALSLLTTH